MENLRLWGISYACRESAASTNAVFTHFSVVLTLDANPMMLRHDHDLWEKLLCASDSFMRMVRLCRASDAR